MKYHKEEKISVAELFKKYMEEEEAAFKARGGPPLTYMPGIYNVPDAPKEQPKTAQEPEPSKEMMYESNEEREAEVNKFVEALTNAAFTVIKQFAHLPIKAGLLAIERKEEEPIKYGMDIQLHVETAKGDDDEEMVGDS